VNTLDVTLLGLVTEVSVIAFDGGASAGDTLTINATGISEAIAFISAVETATSTSMGARQKDVVNLLAYRFEGNGTTNSTDFWTLFSGTNSTMYIHCPTDDTTLNLLGCEVDFLNPSHLGEYNNIIAGDINVRGVRGGAGKYLNMKVQPADFGQDDVMYHAYQSDFGVEFLLVIMGVHTTDQNSQGVSAFWTFNGANSILRVNSSGNGVPTRNSNQGILSFGRSTSTQVQSAGNGKLAGTAVIASNTPISEDVYGHGFHNSSTGGVGSPIALRYAGFAVTPWLSADEYLDFCEAWDEFNRLIIPDGRKGTIGA
jgi:hypothetical protein